jgi:hypothetical protein
MNLTIAGIALAVAMALGGAGGYKATRAHYEHVIEAAAALAAAEVAAANDRAASAAADYETWAARQRPRTVTVTREIEREVKADVDCSARPLPAGLRDALTQAAADADQPVADGAVPAASGAGIGNLWGRGARLFGGAGRAEGLPGAAPGAR